MEISKLSLGTSAIGGLGGYEEQQFLLNAAFDMGIRKFDTAPLYSNGDAEKILGIFAKSNRENIQITTKYGFQSNPYLSSNKLKNLRKVYRKFKNSFKKIDFFISKTTNKLLPPVMNYEIKNLEKSIDQSLKNLSTDYIDNLLLHDWPAYYALNKSTIYEFKKLQKKGKIINWGLGSSQEELQKILLSRNKNNFYAPKIIQCLNSIKNPFQPSKENLKGISLYTHGAISDGLQNIKKYFLMRPGIKEIWERELDIKIIDNSIIAQLCLEFAVYNQIPQIVIFRSSNIKNLKKNISSLESPILGEEGVKKFLKIFNMTKTTNLIASEIN